jgi:hypothetical protein
VKSSIYSTKAAVSSQGICPDSPEQVCLHCHCINLSIEQTKEGDVHKMGTFGENQNVTGDVAKEIFNNCMIQVV